MNPDRFVKVFDVLDSGFNDWGGPAFGLIFVAIGIVIAAFPTIIKATGIPFVDFQSGGRKIFRFAFLSFAVLWTVIVFAGTYSRHFRHESLVQTNTCRVVEGAVEHFTPMPYQGHPVESFSVSGISFRYSDFVVTGGFNNTSSHGGPVNGNSYVRICYDPTDGAILRLEIQDFKGELKNYGTQNIFPRTGDPPKIDNKITNRVSWYGNLFLVLYILDVVAIQRLFLPYLRTFLHIRTVPAWNCAVPDVVQAETKTKLRNTMIYWDKPDHAIWLRPRGFNLIQIPLMVARLNVDANDSAIVGGEIRFSSGFPFVLALMLWMVYQFFTAIPTKGAEGPPAAVFVAFGGFFVLISWINLRILRSRMERLIQDAISELGGMATPPGRL